MIYVTGDIHGDIDISKLKDISFFHIHPLNLYLYLSLLLYFYYF